MSKLFFSSKTYFDLKSLNLCVFGTRNHPNCDQREHEYKNLGAAVPGCATRNCAECRSSKNLGVAAPRCATRSCAEGMSFLVRVRDEFWCQKYKKLVIPVRNKFLGKKQFGNIYFLFLKEYFFSRFFIF